MNISGRRFGKSMNEGYLLRVDDRMFWDNVHANLAQGDEL